MDEENKGSEQEGERAYGDKSVAIMYANYSALNTKRHCVAATC